METIERIKKSLARNNVENYRINKKASRQTELFYIKKKIDITRDTMVTDYAVTVYRDFESDGGKMRGSADALIYADMSDSEMDEAVGKAYFASSFVNNKFYELPSPPKEAEEAQRVNHTEYDLTEEAFKMAEAILSADGNASEEERGESFLNSAEIFARRSDIHIINSNGIDVSYTQYKFEGGFVTQCISGRQDVELHSQFAYRAPEYNSLRQKVREALRNTKDRAQAALPPAAGKYAVMLSGAHVKSLLSYYVSRAGGSMIYPGYSTFAKDAFIQGNEESCRGELLDINLKASSAYSAEGIPMKDRVLTEKGILKTIHSGAKFSYYLGTEPTGDYSDIECLNGSMTLEELRGALKSENDKVLHVAAFSDFQTDSFSGRFGGEIRLAYMYEKDSDGNLKVSILTGGSINGSILEAQSSLAFSKERYKDSTYEGPYAVRIDNVSVAGI